MKITFYGTRGSTPVCEHACCDFGGNTSCLLVEFDNGKIAIIDAGTGIRRLGKDMIENKVEQYDNIFIGLSHTHWDHIQGFPFFEPAYDPKRHFTIAIGGKETIIKDLQQVFEVQMQQEFFPVPLEMMGASFTFYQPDNPTNRTESGIEITATRIQHPGYSYAYRITEGKKSFVYCTDVEHMDGIADNVVKLAQDTNLLIHDAQYTAEELEKRKGWGHSSWNQAVEVAKRSGAKNLVCFHHDPDHTDLFLVQEEVKCQKLFPYSVFARERMVLEV